MSKHEFTLIKIHNPLDPTINEREQRRFKLGQSLADLFPPVFVTADRMAYTVNGGVIDHADMATTLIQPGDFVTECPLPAGGGGNGKMLLRIVAIIAVTVMTAGAGAAAAGAIMGTDAIGFAAAYGALGVAVANAAVTIAGVMLVNALLPPPRPAVGSVGAADSPSYGIDGPKNTSAEGVVVPVAYGQFRMGANILNNYVVNDGDTQWLYMLLCAGEGEVAAISKESLQVNDQPLDSYSTVDGTPDFRFYSGTADQQPPEWFAGTLQTNNVGQKITQEYGYVDTKSVVDGFRMDVSAPNGMFYMDDQGNTSYVGVNLEISYRPWKAGTNTGPWKDFSSQHEIVDYTEDWVYNDVVITDSNGTVISTTPGAEKPGDYALGGFVYRPDGSSALGTIVGYTAEVPVYTGNGVVGIGGNQRTALRRSYLSPKLPEDRYEIRYCRLNAEDTDAKQKRFDTVYLTDIVGVINEKVGYRNTALVAVKLRLSDHLTGIPTITFLNGGKIIDVYGKLPTGDMGWYRAASSNPAWITLDILTNGRYGGGASRSRLDMEKWKDWAAWCDAQKLEFHGIFDTRTNVWDAANQVARCGHAQIAQVGTRYSVLIERPDTPSMLFNVANMVQGSFKEIWLPTTDRANEIELTYYDRDDNYLQKTIRVVDGQAQAAGAPARKVTVDIMGIVDTERAYSEAWLALYLNRYILRTVTFSAPTDSIACAVGDVVMVQHDMPHWGAGGLLEPGSTPTTLNLDRPVLIEGGKTYQALAHLPTLQRYTGRVTAVIGNSVFLSNFDGVSNVRRLLIGTSDMEVLSVVEMSGSHGVTLDSVDGIAVGATYSLHDTNVLVTRTVLNQVPAGQAVETQTLTLTASLGVAPPDYGKWTFGEVNRTSKPFRVRSISGGSEYTRELTCIEYSEAVYDPAGQGENPNYSSLPSLEIKPVTIDGVSEEQVLNGLAYEPRVTIAYHSYQETYQNAEVFLSLNDGAFKSIGMDRSGITLPALKGQKLTFRVVSIDRLGRSASLASAPMITYIVQGRVEEPGAVTGLNATFTNTGLLVTWNRPLDLDWVRTELRSGGTSAGNSAEKFSGQLTQYELDWVANPGNYNVFARNVTASVSDAAFAQLTLNVLVPRTPAPQVVVNALGSVTLMWSDARSSQALKKHRIRAGSTALGFDQLTDAAVISGNSQTHTLIFNDPGTYRIWVQAEDMGGLIGTAGYVDVAITATSIKGDKGDTGAPGVRAAYAAVYAWALNLASLPALQGTSTFTWASGAVSPAPTGWAVTPGNAPSAGYSLYRAQVYVTDGSTAATSTVDWTKGAIAQIGAAGAAGSSGAAGVSSAVVYIYQRAATAPALPTAATVYTFASGVLTGLNGGWTTTPPAGSNPLYVSVATASAAAATATIAAGGWATPVVLAKDGADGASGLNTATVFLYQRNDTGVAPALPAAQLTYTFASGALTGTVGSWSQTIPGTGGKYLFVTTATALSSGATDTIATAEWSAARVMAQDGSQGGAGSSGASARIAYAVATGSTLNPTPTTVTTTGATTFPPANSWGGGETWQGTIATYGANQSVFKLDGVYDPITNKTVWGAPYLANWKVGNLAAISANLGSVNAGQIDIGSGRFQVSSSGYLVARGAQLLDDNGNVIFSTRAGSLAALPSSWVQAAAGWLNTNLTITSDGKLSGGGGGQVTLPGIGLRTFRIGSAGTNAQPPAGFKAGVWDMDTGATIGSAVTRSYLVVELDRSTFSVIFTMQYDVYASGANTPGHTAGTMAEDLNYICTNRKGNVIVVVGYDEPQAHRMDSGLPDAMYRCGASRAIFGSASFPYRGAYILVGVAGAGEGNGVESLTKTGDGVDAWTELTMTVRNGAVSVSGSATTPRSLTDYGFTGDLNATFGATMGSSLKNQAGGVVNSIGTGNLFKNADFRLNNGSIPSYLGGYTWQGNQTYWVGGSNSAVGNGPYWQINATTDVTQNFGFVISPDGVIGGWPANTNFVITFYACANGGFVGRTFNPSWNVAPNGVTWIENPAMTGQWARYSLLVNRVATTDGFFFYIPGGRAGDVLDISNVSVTLGESVPGFSVAGIGASNPITPDTAAVMIASASIGTALIQYAAITSALIANLAVGNAHIQNLAVDSGKIANLAVTNAKIQNAAIDNAKIADLAVTNAKIANLSVDTAKIADLAVGTVKIGDNAVTVPIGAFTAAAVTALAAGTTIQTATITSSGGKIVVFPGAQLVDGVGSTSGGSAPAPCSMTLFRNGAQVMSGQVLPAFVDSVPAGTWTYTLVAYTGNPGSGISKFGTASNRSITLFEAKK